MFFRKPRLVICFCDFSMMSHWLAVRLFMPYKWTVNGENDSDLDTSAIPFSAFSFSDQPSCFARYVPLCLLHTAICVYVVWKWFWSVSV